MKKFLSILMVFLMAVTFVFAGDGTWSIDASKREHVPAQGEVITFACSVDSIDTLTSRTFSMTEFDGMADSTFSEVPMAYKVSSSAGTPKVTVYIQGSYDDENYFSIDTIATDQTAETLQKGFVDVFKYIVPYHQVVIEGIETSRADTEFKMWLYPYWKKD